MTDTPALWPGMDPTADNRLAAAWRDLWAGATQPVEWALARDELAARHDLAHRTTDNIIRTAVRNGHLTKRGGYSHKRHTDTRTIERKDHR